MAILYDNKTGSKRILAARILAVIVILIMMTTVLVLLHREAQGVYRYLSIVPKLGEAPVYERTIEGESTGYTYIADRDMHVSALKLLVVHTPESLAMQTSYMDITVRDLLSSDSTSLYETVLYGEDMSAGEWIDISADFEMHDRHMYEFIFTPHGCEPYFMHVDGYASDISLGFEYRDDTVIRYGDVFCYSVPLTVLTAVISIFLILFGRDRVCKALNSIFKPDGNERSRAVYVNVFSAVMLLLMFITISLKIYKTAYADGIYITADSDGYLREAVNLTAGNGFSYEGLAGYESHFANWPIVYPLMIAAVMLMTGTNAYLASKIVSIITIGVIFIILYAEYKKHAWLYALAFTNAGFMALAYNTWSEIPFVLFMLLFAVMLGKLLRQKKPAAWVYAGVGLSAVLAFLTRYFGIYLWFTEGVYWLILFIRYMKARSLGSDSKDLRVQAGKLIRIFVTMCISGLICVAYLIMNKLKNGNPTGVSRGTWWDDLVTLTDDLIHSLITEIFNIFSVNVPEYIEQLDTHLQVWIVLLAVSMAAWLIYTCIKAVGAGKDIIMSTPVVLIMMSVIYYVMFIAVRYRSSMDTFYFRFFAPATVLFTAGLTGLIIMASEALSAHPKRIYAALAAVTAVMTAACLLNMTESADEWMNERSYYDIATGIWDEAYSEIPYKSVILWNPMDFRSSWYRPDVYSGELYTDDTIDSLKERYYASEHICMLRSDAQTVIADGGYDPGLTDSLKDAVLAAPKDNSFVVIP